MRLYSICPSGGWGVAGVGFGTDPREGCERRRERFDGERLTVIGGVGFGETLVVGRAASGENRPPSRPSDWEVTAVGSRRKEIDLLPTLVSFPRSHPRLLPSSLVPHESSPPFLTTRGAHGFSRRCAGSRHAIRLVPTCSTTGKEMDGACSTTAAPCSSDRRGLQHRRRRRRRLAAAASAASNPAHRCLQHRLRLLAASLVGGGAALQQQSPQPPPSSTAAHRHSTVAYHSKHRHLDLVAQLAIDCSTARLASKHFAPPLAATPGGGAAACSKAPPLIARAHPAIA